ncbi:peptide ABC transporter permease [Acrocarpospora pleiomorpha]|uniref:Peptide ABC transporter permease n=1 Tax=Acrocarpospora pleiomorpha TaxID=90975 RepID=A0A5M3XGI7_9ACTN|nr:ABC transporter permease [Acrocarpospora pleiomorpha]GES20394.1 peptide ABC transporter permease [Acrocarpospora pleiomorpha]
MIPSLARRTGQALITALLASVVVWGLLPLAPGDPAVRYLQARHVSAPTEEQLARARADLGLDRPLPEQYVRWLGGVVRGDLGQSTRLNLPVTRVIAERAPATLRLTLATVLLALVVSLPLALAGAAAPGRWPDAAGRYIALLGAALPSFVAGLLLIEFVIVRLGAGSVVSDGSWSQVWLPAAALALYPIARWSRLLRGGLLEGLRSEHVTVAAARGTSRARALVVHALPNASVPFVTVLAMTVGFLLGGAAVVENVFSWPGLGREIVLAVTARDLPVVQGFALVMSLAWVTISLLADVATALIDPRLREGSGR